jgi:hypothetical protein
MKNPMQLSRGGLLTPSAPFEMVRDQQFTMPMSITIDLGVARTEQTAIELPVAGNVFYADADPQYGNCRVEFNDKGRDSTDTNYYVSPGFISYIPFTKLRIWNTAQPGKTIQLVYGVDIPFQPGSVAQIAVSNTGGFTAVRPEAPTGTFVSSGLLGAGASEVVFTAASNVNGAIVLGAQAFDTTGAVVRGGFVAKAAAPADELDGSPVLLMRAWTPAGASISTGADLAIAQFIPAGVGLYFGTFSGMTVNSSRYCRYKLL